MTLTKKEKRAVAYARAKAAMEADKYKVQAVQAKKASVRPNSPPVAVRVKKEEARSRTSTPVVPPSPAKKRQARKENMDKQAAKEDAMRRAKEYGQKDLKSLQKRNKNNVSFLQHSHALEEEEGEEEESLPASKKRKFFAHTGQEPAGVSMAADHENMVDYKHVLPLKHPCRNWLIAMTSVILLVWIMAKCLSTPSSSLTPYDPPQRIHLLEELIQSAQKSGTPVQINLDRRGEVSVQLGFEQLPAAIE